MADITQREQVLRLVGTAFDMVLEMVEFEVPRIIPIPLLPGPVAIFAAMLISNKDLPSGFIRDLSVMSRELTIFLQEVHA